MPSALPKRPSGRGFSLKIVKLSKEDFVEQPKAVRVELPIDWQFPKDLSSRYATHLIVQHTEHEFVLSFFEILPPTIFGSPEAISAQLEQLSSIPAECVGRIVVAAERMPAFVAVLQENLERYQSREFLEED